jgi:hypothetical protein
MDVLRKGHRGKARRVQHLIAQHVPVALRDAGVERRDGDLRFHRRPRDVLFVVQDRAPDPGEHAPHRGNHEVPDGEGRHGMVRIYGAALHAS